MALVPRETQDAATNPLVPSHGKGILLRKGRSFQFFVEHTHCINQEKKKKSEYL